MLETLILSAVDCIYEITEFLTAIECYNFSMSGKAIQKIVDSERTWKYFIQNRISGFNTGFRNNYFSIIYLKDLLGFRTAKDFYLSFRRLEVHILGWLRALPPFNEDGGLFLGKCIENELQFQFIDIDGEVVHNKSFKISYDNDLRCLVAQPFNSIGVSFRVELGKKIKFLPVSLSSSPSLFNITFESIIATIDASTNIIRNSSNTEQDLSVLETIMGFNTSRYNQGCVVEILNLSVVNQSSSSWMKPVDIRSFSSIYFGHLQLHGWKVTGDENVPSGEVSFCINLDREVDARTRLLWWQRRIAYYPSIPYGRENFSVEERQDNIAAWFSGYMQIALPGFRQQSWSPCQFILYRTPLANGVRFNIVWDARLSATEFRPLFPGNASELLEGIDTLATMPPLPLPLLLPSIPDEGDGRK